MSNGVAPDSQIRRTKMTSHEGGAIAEPRLYLRLGLYTVSEAARYLRKNPQTVAAWKRRFLDCLRETTDSGFVAFLELVELMYVKAFREAGVPLSTIVQAAERLRTNHNTDYPFATAKVDATELKTLIVRTEQQNWETADSGQKTFPFVEQFRKQIHFDAQGLAAAWFPLGTDKHVVLDPRRSFGAPIDKDSGVPTSVLARAFEAESEDIAKVAWWYEVAEEAVRDAVLFERSFAA